MIALFHPLGGRLNTEALIDGLIEMLAGQSPADSG